LTSQPFSLSSVYLPRAPRRSANTHLGSAPRVIFFGAQFHFCADVTAAPAASHFCPVCSATSSAVAPKPCCWSLRRLPSDWKARRQLSLSTDIPRAISPRVLRPPAASADPGPFVSRNHFKGSAMKKAVMVSAICFCVPFCARKKAFLRSRLLAIGPPQRRKRRG